MNSRWPACALVLAVSLAASATSLRNGFVYDDVPVIQLDKRVHAFDLPRLLASPYWSVHTRDKIYRPLTTTSFALDWVAGRGSPLVFHLTNIVLHAAVCLLVFALARAVVGTGPGALVAALWFAVHPLHVEVVANSVGRSELLAALGYLGALLAYGAEGREARERPAGGRRAAYAVLALLAAAAAFGGKEHALTLPAALLLVDAWAAHRRNITFLETLGAHAATWIGVVALALGYLAVRHAVLGTTFGGGNIAAGLSGLGSGGRAAVMLPAMLVWARLLALPLWLSADYSPNHFVPLSSLDLAHVGGALLVIGAVVAAVALWRRMPAVAAGVAGFAITASVAANVVFPTGVLVAERVLYLPSAGAALVVGALWEQLRGRALWPATALALAALAARSLARIPVWHDEQHFFAALIADAPDSYKAHWARGARAFDAGRAAEGEREFLEAIRIWPLDAELLQELGDRYQGAGLFAPADRWYTAAWRLDHARADAATGAVIARMRLGHADSAAALGDSALRFVPDAPTLLLATGDAVRALGHPALALTYRRRMVFAAPGAWQFQYLAADGAARTGRCDEARWRAGRAAALAEGDSAAAAVRRLRVALGSGRTCRVPA